MSTGSFCWALLASSEPERSKQFYGSLFGWDDGFGDVAGVDQLEPELAGHGVPSHWRSFVAVEDLDATAARARELGAFAPGGPRELDGRARIQPLFDPQGAPVALWQPLGDGGSSRSLSGVGSICLFELQARDLDAALKFYTQLFGWDAGSENGYTSFTLDGGEVAAMRLQDPRWGDAPTLWLPYIMVESCDAAADRMASLGAAVGGLPEDHPRGRVAVAHDPQDAVFGVLELR